MNIVSQLDQVGVAVHVVQVINYSNILYHIMADLYLVKLAYSIPCTCPQSLCILHRHPQSPPSTLHIGEAYLFCFTCGRGMILMITGYNTEFMKLCFHFHPLTYSS